MMSLESEDGTTGNIRKPLLERSTSRLVDLRGKLFSLSFATTLGIQLFLVKVVEESVTVYTIMLLRSLSFLFVIPFIQWTKCERFQTKDMCLYFLYGILNYGCRIVAYVALTFAQVGNVSAITSNMAIPSAILGLLLLGEPITTFHVISFVINAVGIIFVSKPPFIFQYIKSSEDTTDDFYGAILAVVVVITRSLASVVSRKLSYESKSDPVLFAVFTGICGVIITSFILIFTELTMPRSFLDQLTVLGVCVCALLGNIFLALALQYETVVVVSVLMSPSLIVAYLLQIVLLGVHPGVPEIFGLLLILGSNFAYLWQPKED